MRRRKFEAADTVRNVRTKQVGVIVGFMTGDSVKYLVKGEDFEDWMPEPLLEKEEDCATVRGTAEGL